MADTASSSSGMDEYKFQEDEGVATLGGADEQHEHVASAVASAKPPHSLRGKRLFVTVGIIVAIIIVYQLMNLYYSKTAQTDEVAMARKSQGTARLATSALEQRSGNVMPSAASTVQQPVEQSASAATVQPTASDISTQQKLEILAERAEKNTTQMERMKEDMARSQAVISRLNQSNEVLSKTVQDLNDTIQKLHAPQPIIKKATKKIKRAHLTKMSYVVKAIVPGLVWLESSRGDTVALRVGDELPGYGKISIIAPQQGMVATTSGAMFQYGVNDT
jgi:hypothetical protein